MRGRRSFHCNTFLSWRSRNSHHNRGRQMFLSRLAIRSRSWRDARGVSQVCRPRSATFLLRRWWLRSRWRLNQWRCADSREADHVAMTRASVRGGGRSGDRVHSPSARPSYAQSRLGPPTSTSYLCPCVSDAFARPSPVPTSLRVSPRVSAVPRPGHPWPVEDTPSVRTPFPAASGVPSFARQWHLRPRRSERLRRGSPRARPRPRSSRPARPARPARRSRNLDLENTAGRTLSQQWTSPGHLRVGFPEEPVRIL